MNRGKVRGVQAEHFPVSEGHTLYVETSGNPEGIPVLFVHGGPGAGLPENYRQFFDPTLYFIIGYEQRGCGRSTPKYSLEANTTQWLLADIEALRNHLGIEQWVIFGGSWGATLSLLAAINAPATVLGLVLRGVFLARQQDRDWFLTPSGGPAQLFPDDYQQFVRGVPAPLSSDAICEYYAQQFALGDAQAAAAMLNWIRWEERLSRLCVHSMLTDTPALAPEGLLNTLARFECHYLMNHCFIPENHILDNLHLLASIPTIIVHGRYDMICKTEAAVSLANKLEHCELIMVDAAGHSTSEPAISRALCDATLRLQQTLSGK